MWLLLLKVLDADVVVTSSVHVDVVSLWWLWLFCCCWFLDGGVVILSGWLKHLYSIWKILYVCCYLLLALLFGGCCCCVVMSLHVCSCCCGCNSVVDCVFCFLIVVLLLVFVHMVGVVVISLLLVFVHIVLLLFSG